jgi:Cu/Ag efflux pump CusA
MLLVFLVMTAFLNLKLEFWVAIGIPVSFTGALIIMPMNWFDLSLSTVTLFEFVMVLGVVVDDAIIVGESIYTKKQDNYSTELATFLGIKKVAISDTFGVLTTIAAFWLLAKISSEMGQAFRQLGWVIVFCLICSLIESKLIFPFDLKNIQIDSGKENPSGWLIFKIKCVSCCIGQQEKVISPYKKSTSVSIFSLIFFIFFDFICRFSSFWEDKKYFFPELGQEFLEARFDIGEDLS